MAKALYALYHDGSELDALNSCRRFQNPVQHYPSLVDCVIGLAQATLGTVGSYNALSHTGFLCLAEQARDITDS